MGKTNEYIQLQKKQLQLEVEAIKLLMSHAGSKGAEGEKALVNLLKKYLPKKYSFGSGFVSKRDKLSPQMDIIIWDENLNSPIYRGEQSSVYPLGAVYGCIEVTVGRLTTQKLEQDIKKLGKMRALAGERKVSFRKTVSVYEEGKGPVVKVENFQSGPPPRSFIMALGGTNYKSPESLATTLRRMSKKYRSHIHGLLVIDQEQSKSVEKEWLIFNEAYCDFKCDWVESDSLFYLFQKMNAGFEGMWVGKYPAG